VFFSSNINKPQVLKRWGIEKSGKKLQETPQIKGEVNISRGEKHFNLKDPF
jgi:hypothetical protein